MIMYCFWLDVRCVIDLFPGHDLRKGTILLTFIKGFLVCPFVERKTKCNLTTSIIFKQRHLANIFKAEQLTPKLSFNAREKWCIFDSLVNFAFKILTWNVRARGLFMMIFSMTIWQVCIYVYMMKSKPKRKHRMPSVLLCPWPAWFYIWIQWLTFWIPAVEVQWVLWSADFKSFNNSAESGRRYGFIQDNSCNWAMKISAGGGRRMPDHLYLITKGRTKDKVYWHAKLVSGEVLTASTLLLFNHMKC